MATQVVWGTFAKVSGGISGTAPEVFVGSSDQTAAVMLTAGAVSDLYSKGIIKAKDVIYVNGDEDGTPFQNVYTVTSTSGGSLITYPNAVGGALLADNNLDDVSSVATALVNLGLASNQIRYATVAMTAAEWNGMYAAPKLLVAAGGANTLIVPERIYAEMTYGAAAYAAGGVVGVQYDSTVQGAGVAASTTIAAASFQATASTSFLFNGALTAAAFSTTVNKGLYLSNLTGAFTTGDSTWVIHLYYNIIATV